MSSGGLGYCDCNCYGGGDGEEMVVRLLHDEHSFSPDHTMSFSQRPRAVAGISTDAIKKIDYENQY